MRQDINEKENKIRDLNHRHEILSEVSELKLNDINNQITSIHNALNNIISSHKAKNDYPKISSHNDIDERYSFKNSDKTQDSKTIITQNRYEILTDSGAAYMRKIISPE